MKLEELNKLNIDELVEYVEYQLKLEKIDFDNIARDCYEVKKEKYFLFLERKIYVNKNRLKNPLSYYFINYDGNHFTRWDDWCHIDVNKKTLFLKLFKSTKDELLIKKVKGDKNTDNCKDYILKLIVEYGMYQKEETNLKLDINKLKELSNKDLMNYIERKTKIDREWCFDNMSNKCCVTELKTIKYLYTTKNHEVSTRERLIKFIIDYDV